MDASIVGSLLFAVPAILLARVVLWHAARPVFWSCLAMILVATGYLNATGATRDLAASALGYSCCEPAPKRAR